jgi:hypothetical protein
MHSATGVVAALAGLPAVLVFMAAVLMVGTCLLLVYASPQRAIR